MLVLYANIETLRKGNWGEQMLKNEIEQLRGKLNEMISKKENDQLIYDLSIQLDELIVNYYKEIGMR